jgi:hypothetical protein
MSPFSFSGACGGFTMGGMPFIRRFVTSILEILKQFSTFPFMKDYNFSQFGHLSKVQTLLN